MRGMGEEPTGRLAFLGGVGGLEEGEPVGVAFGEDGGDGEEEGHVFFELLVEGVAGLGGGLGFAFGGFLEVV